MLAAAKVVRQHAALGLDAMVTDFERATGPWHVEWIVVPEAFILTAGALNQARFMLAGLEVDTARMRANLDMTRSEEHTSELQSLMRISYAVFCLKKKKTSKHHQSQK